MHEMGIAVEVYRACRKVVAEHGGNRIERVRLAVCELTAVEPDLIEFAWEAVTVEGPDQGSVLEITWCPAHQFCPGCGEEKERSRGSWLRLCPDCDTPLAVSGGDELDIMEVALLTDEDDDGEPGDGKDTTA